MRYRVGMTVEICLKPDYLIGLVIEANEETCRMWWLDDPLNVVYTVAQDDTGYPIISEIFCGAFQSDDV